MALFKATQRPMARTLRVLAHLLGYPDEQRRAAWPEMQAALRDEAALSPGRLAEIDRLLQRLGQRRPLVVESEYVELFDRGRGTALHLFEHVHGDSRDRGPAMVDLCQTYEAAGLHLAPGELPDHLCVMLEYASTQPPEQAAAFLGEVSHLLRLVFSALLKRHSDHACLLAALLDLAGEPAVAVPVLPEPAIDDSWSEPLAFGGCSTAGQASPGTTQTIHIVRQPVAHGRPSPGVQP